MGNLNCASYIAGIIAGVLETANFPATVTAVTSKPDDEGVERTVFLVNFSEQVMEREERLG